MKKETLGKIIFSLAVVATIFLAKVAGASTVAPTAPAVPVANEKCQREVATATAQLINLVSADEKTASIKVDFKEVTYLEKSATVFLIPASMGGPDTVTAGGDVWESSVHRTIGTKKDTFVIEANTQTNRANECRVLSMTIVDHIDGR